MRIIDNVFSNQRNYETPCSVYSTDVNQTEKLTMDYKLRITCMVLLLVSMVSQLVSLYRTQTAQINPAMVNVHVNVADESTKLRITAWNCRGVKGAQAYIMELMQNSDIVALSEHQLYSNELSFLNDPKW